MPGSFVTYKLASRNISLERADVKRLIDFVIEKTAETKETQRQNIDFNQIPQQQAEELRADLEEAYKTAIFIYGADGEELLVYDSTIVDTPQFPEVITRLTIDSFIRLFHPFSEQSS